MKTLLEKVVLVTLILIASPLRMRADSILRCGPVPQGVGVNIHFVRPEPGEMKLLGDCGMGWVRADFQWQNIEKTRGVYDFSSYDELMNDLDAVHMHPLFILDYGNPLYEKNSPSTDESRAAFARWAAASATHYAGRGVIWEMWNEPNGGFWRPKTDPAAYARLALLTGKAIHAVEPSESFIGPATAHIDIDFCEACFQSGCLEEWSAVSVHAYRGTGPETVVDDFKKLSDVIAKYAPAGESIPIVSGEWGWSNFWQDITPDMQGNYLVRQWLINAWQHVPLSIYYDWRNDGTDPKNSEHHFGMVDRDFKPKPAYFAAKTFTTQLNGFSFDRRITTERPDDYCLLFSKGDENRLVVWTTKESATIKISVPDGEFRVFSVTGEELPRLHATQGVLSVSATPAPQYLRLAY
jgi:hypothetical protein